MTDTEGRFEIGNLVPVAYRIWVTAAGYSAQEYGAGPGRGKWGTGEVVQVRDGKNVGDIHIVMRRQGIISGRITSENGEPLTRMHVDVLTRTLDADGWEGLRNEGSGETDDRGEYRIAGLGLGRYFIRARPVYLGIVYSESAQAALEGLPAPTKPTRGIFAETFYPGVLDFSGAQSVLVSAGEETNRINFVLARTQTYSVRGHISDDSVAGALPRISLGVIPTPPSKQVTSTSISTNGDFEVRDLTPGTYWIQANPTQSMTDAERQQRAEFLATPGADATQLPRGPMGRTLVSIRNTDVENVQIKIVRNLSVAGRIVMEDGSPIPPTTKPQLRNVGTDGKTSAPGHPVPTVNADGSFVIRNLIPGGFRVGLSGLPQDMYLKEVRLGDKDVRFQTFQITDYPESPLAIFLAKGADVTGAVTSQTAEPMQDKQIVLIPQGSVKPSELYRTAATDAAGHFLLQGVAPGQYKVFAWNTVDGYAYLDPDFVRQFEDQGVTVSIRDATRVIVDMKINP
jgi:hypothetical protein